MDALEGEHFLNPLAVVHLAKRKSRMNIHSLMRLANYLTISRILMVPLLMLSFRYNLPLLALVVFVAASLTDYLDGCIARRQGTTSFGKFMDPLADKLLVGATLICLTRFGDGLIPGWMVITIVGREFVVTGLRIAFIVTHGAVVPATVWGKYKTSSQMGVITISLVLLVIYAYGKPSGYPVDLIVTRLGPIYFMMYLPLVLTVASGLEFLYNNRKAFYDLMRSADTYTDDDL
jgi:CDP-diacylglycerol--glycerol-3-phosphate 3-phosphatidyltransferase